MKRIKILAAIGIAVFLALLSSNVMAGTEKGKLSLSPHFGGYIFDKKEQINNDPVYGLGIGYGFTESFGIEASIDHVDTVVSWPDTAVGKTNVDANLFNLDLLYNINLADDTKWYIAVGSGYMNIDVDKTIDNTDVQSHVALGLKFFLTDSLLARGDARQIVNWETSNINYMYTVGLSYLIGGHKATPPPPPAPSDSDGDGVYDADDKCPNTPAGTSVDIMGCPLDSDADGVYDYLDKCPGTPKGAAVDMNGCPLDSDADGVADYLDKCPNTPAGAAVDMNGCPLDSDGDGVVDYLDKCPGTLKGAAVNENGCPLDSDGDGVLDVNDKCPNTPSGVQVDANGCPLDSDGDGVYDYLDKCPGTLPDIKVDANGCPLPIKEKVSIELNVEFEFNSAVVKSVYQEQITKVSNFLSTYPDVNAVIEGHTDSKGTDEYNMKLSQKRAENVMNYLVSKGIAADRLTAKGFGESLPIADNNTDEGRQKNRRVVAVISTIVTK
ncbi:MAG: OmpA family protein [Nitrospirae bacterium]|nr:OmpA family protein [Nitrospirota bacterium]